MEPVNSRTKQRAAPASRLPDASESSPFHLYTSGTDFRFDSQGAVYHRTPQPLRSVLRIHDFGDGGIEASTSPVYDWVEVEPMGSEQLAASIAAQHTVQTPTAQELLDKAAMNSERSTRRARTKVRRLAKWKCLDTMLTLTYAENQCDRALMQKHLAAFVRRVRGFIPGFEYVAVFEQQKRGAWHCHMAVARIKSGYWIRGTLVHSWHLLRRIWRAVVKGGGNIDVKAPGQPGRSISKLAGYLTKYLCKDLHLAEKYQNSYQASGCTLPPAVVVHVNGRCGLANAYFFDLMTLEASTHDAYVSSPLSSGGYFLTLTPPG